MKKYSNISRRKFLSLSLKGSAALIAAPALLGLSKGMGKQRRLPNILLLITDQQGQDTLSSMGCRYLQTPNLDRLKKRGVAFTESYSVNPVCSPARSSLLTGRMSSETGVIYNGLPIRPQIPNLGQWLSQLGYQTIYVGKWHLPHGYQAKIPGFTVFPAGLGLRGTIGDESVSRVSEGFLRNYRSQQPFLLVVSLLQPHDINNWIKRHNRSIDELPITGIEDELPPLPPNFQSLPVEPKQAKIARKEDWNDLTWRYYLWSYYRMIEEVDREIGRILDALEETKLAENTLVFFTSDHGEGRGRHRTILKNFLYEEAVKVPLIVSFPGRINEDIVDTEHLVSGLDIIPTVAEFLQVDAPPDQRGYGMKALLEGKPIPWREFLVAEVRKDQGRMIRTREFKLIAYRKDPVIQLFDLKKDPWETQNLATNPHVAGELKELLKLLEQWEKNLDFAPNALGPFQIKI